MKNKMPTRKSIGKTSTFLTSLKRKKGGRSFMREMRRNPLQIPSSTKVGAGDIVARRRLPQQIVHKRNHRTNELRQG